MAGTEGEAFPISPPTAKEVGRIPVDPSSPTLDADALAAHDDDVPSRLRAAPPAERTRDALHDAPSSDASFVLGKHTSEAPSSDVAAKWMKLDGGERSDVILATSDAFDGQLDAWDLDDAQLYSGEQLILAADVSPANTPGRRVPQTPVAALQRFLEDVCVQEDEGHGAHVHRVDGDMLLQARTLLTLHSMLRRCARDTDRLLELGGRRSDGAPQTILDLDATLLDRLLSLLERTMRNAASHFAPDEALDASVEVSTSGLLGAQCALTILAYDALPKFLFSEELMEQCVAAVKEPLEKLAVPIVEAVQGGTGTFAATATALLQGAEMRELNTHFHLICSTLLLLERVLNTSLAVSDTLIISCVYLALTPFFVQDKEVDHKAPSVYAKAHVLRPVRLSGLNLLRSIFAHYPQQRTWVLSEVLVSLLRLPDLRARYRQFRLSNGKAIYSITALLLQLVQAASIESAHSRERMLAWVEGEAAETDDAKDAPAQANQAAVHALASTIAVFLSQKAAQAKMVKSSQDLSYATIVYCLMEDLLTLLFLPDWPAAPLLLSCFCRIFVSFVQDAKSSVDAKAIALDHLGVVAARVRLAQDEIEGRKRRLYEVLPPLAQICADRDEAALLDVEHATYGVVQRLCKGHADEPGIQAASAFYLSQLRYELLLAMQALRAKDERDEFASVLAATFRRVPLAETSKRVDAAVVPQLVLASAFFVTLPMLIAPLVQGANAQALASRTRALRGLGNLSAVDAALLDDSRVRSAVLAHVTDTSASVRETAIAILGTYVLHKPDARTNYRVVLAERVKDAAVGVRKRVVRLLRSLYTHDDAYDDKLDTVVRILRCVHDEDPGLQALAVQTLAELWLPECVESDGYAEPTAVVAQMLADVGARVRERPSPLEAFLRRAHKGDTNDTLHARLGELVDSLLGSLFAEETTPGVMLDRMRVVQVLVATYPAVLTVNRAKQLLSYVEGAESVRIPTNAAR